MTQIKDWDVPNPFFYVFSGGNDLKASFLLIIVCLMKSRQAVLTAQI